MHLVKIYPLLLYAYITNEIVGFGFHVVLSLLQCYNLTYTILTLCITTF